MCAHVRCLIRPCVSRFVTGSHYASAGLPEMLGFGAVSGSLKQGEDGGYGQRRRLKPGKSGKKGKKKK